MGAWVMDKDGVSFRWKIYRGDGETLASWEVDDVFNIPILFHRGVQVIVEEIPGTGAPWVTTCGDHHYVWDNRGLGYRWFGANDAGLYDYMIQPGKKCILLGETVDNNKFSEIFQRAMNDPDFKHPKETFARNERHPT